MKIETATKELLLITDVDVIDAVIGVIITRYKIRYCNDIDVLKLIIYNKYFGNIHWLANELKKSNKYSVSTNTRSIKNLINCGVLVNKDSIISLNSDLNDIFEAIAFSDVIAFRKCICIYK